MAAEAYSRDDEPDPGPPAVDRARAEPAASPDPADPDVTLARIGHELRTPLNAIIGFTELMLTEPFGPVGHPRYAGYLGDILESARHALAVIEGLAGQSHSRDPAALAAGPLLEEVDVNALVSRTVSSLSLLAAERGLVLETCLAPDLGNWRAAPLGLRQMLINLLANSMRFTGAGGRIVVSTGRTATGELAIEVTDDGPGIEDWAIRHAMEAPPLPQRPAGGGGSGLGLPLTRSLAEMQGGRLEIERRPGRGTLARIVLGGRDTV
ncbi:MAG: HAMP domain-containing sensor histidine kinase [Hyphomicrobiaceae bacterium]